MEFKTLRNIENSFRQIRLYAIVFAVLCISVVGYAVWRSYRFAEEQRQKIYVLDNGKSLMLALNVQQRIEVDSVVCNFDNYPYAVRTYAKQFIIRSSNVTRRNLITSCYLVNSVRSDNNPQGFNIEKFAVVENKDIEVIER